MTYKLYASGTSTAQILTDTNKPWVFVNSSGNDIFTGYPWFPNMTPAQIIQKCSNVIIPINSSGTTLS